MSKNKNLLQNILYEASSYRAYEDIEKLVEKGINLSSVPVQPLYVSLQNATSDQVALVLPKLSKEQRQCFLDLDLWNKDNISVETFENWIEIYSKCKDDSLVKEFVSSDEFLSYLKARVNIYTFDTEDPQYPDHDFYFLTDDNLLLIEYSEEFNYAHEIKYLIRHFYDVYGVDKAYAQLFKLINDSFIIQEEEMYQHKKERLRDFGFVDYYEAKEKLFPFVGHKSLDKFITKKVPVSVRVGTIHKNQSLHSSALVNFDRNVENLMQELMKLNDADKISYLHFSFVRLINSTITLHDALKGGRVELTKIGEYTKTILELGLEYTKSKRDFKESQSAFEFFDFFDLYKIGHSLIQLNISKIKKALASSPFEKDDFEYFLGTWWNGFLENTFLGVPKVKAFGVGRHPQVINSLSVYNFWKSESETFILLVPFVTSFFNMYTDLKKSGKVNDQFYLNYTVDNIDFESIMISSFANFVLNSDTENKMGLTINEFKMFITQLFDKKEEEYNIKSFDTIRDSIANFSKKYGLSEVNEFETYLYGILSEHLSGYEYDTLADEDFGHVGGPILLNTLQEH
jgi:hypothetical protein